jgi:diaminohydroxyphosphoribosylaminopyrimidine deaminase / 5-amino-6-(5-phosphoribosylamino)uracil reductase
MNEREKFMKICLELAEKGLGKVAPNPMVGCVIVHNNEIIGQGYHQKYGESHAEVNAINSVKDGSLLSNSTLFVNLEPCSHFGKTPPCADLIVKNQIAEVIIGCRDNNPIVSGKGIEKLKNGGCKVETGILEKECLQLNRRFFTFHEKKRPYIILKWAQTKDGFIDKNRNSLSEASPLIITGEQARKLSHKWRAEEQAILVGTTTALLDNPQLNVRFSEGKNPVRVLLDKDLRVPDDYYLLDGNSETLIFTSKNSESGKEVKYIVIDFKKDIIEQVLLELYQRNIQSVIVEGGTKMINSFLEQDLWDEARVFVSSVHIGKGVGAPVINAKPVSEKAVGEDQLLFYRNK